MTYLPPPKGAFDVEWATQNNRIIQQELGRLQPLQVRVADLESGKQPLDGDLTAIAALTGTGYIRRTADDTWAISATIPNTSISGLGTMATQNATAVAITGGTATLSTLTTGHVQVTGGSFGAGRLYKSVSHGTALVASAGSSYDAALFNPAGSAAIWRVPTGTNNVEFTGTLSTSGNATLGDATTDAHVINGSLVGTIGSGGWVINGTGTNLVTLQATTQPVYRISQNAGSVIGDFTATSSVVTIRSTTAHDMVIARAAVERARATSTGFSVTGTLSATGNLSAANFAGSTWTPTLRSTVDVNISSSSFQSATYIRVGSAVMATIQLFITPSATGSVQFSVSLPVSSNLTSVYQLGGNCAARDTVPITGMVVGSATNDNAVAEFVAATTNIHEVTVQIFYPIL